MPKPGRPDFLDLPWSVALDRWGTDRLAVVDRGIGRHVVRFVDYDGTLYALKELPTHLAWKEYRLLRALEEERMPVVEVVGVAADRGGDLNAVLITKHLEFSLPFRALFWGDGSLPNTLFRRDAGALAAYLVDAETGELHPALSDGQRLHDVEIARENLVGELLDVEAELGVELERPPEDTADELVSRYEGLWSELVREETFAPDERYRIDDRLHRLNELGFDVEELELVGGEDGYRLKLNPRVVEPGHHRRRLLETTGLRAQENQARRLLNDLARYRAHLEEEAGRPLPTSVAAARWLVDVFEPAIAAVPSELWNKRQAAEVFHELLEHRWFLSQKDGKDVGLMPAVADYVENVLRHAPDERRILVEPADDFDEPDEPA